MAKGASQQDLDRRIVSSEPAAKRVAEVSRLVAVVLLKHDPRIRELYDGWKTLLSDNLPQRVHLMTQLHETWSEWAPDPATVLSNPDVETSRLNCMVWPPCCGPSGSANSAGYPSPCGLRSQRKPWGSR